jgi:hypothetical protein
VNRDNQRKEFSNKEYPTMATQVALKTKAKEEATPRTGALMPRREFPFFLSGMRDEFDRFFDRFFQQLPIPYEGGEGKITETHEQECYESLTLPPGIDKDKVDARYRNGVLTITFPRTTEGKARRVPVKDA